MNFWRLSAGTAAVVAGLATRSEAPPTTAYVMLGEKCRNNCRFCTQARESGARANMLSRVTWPAAEAAKTIIGIDAAYVAGRIRRACLQVVHDGDDREGAAEAVSSMSALSGVPVCVSSNLETVNEARRLIAAGADRICVALDAATPAAYRAAKEGDWDARWRLLAECAAALPGRVTTHLIVGLGETEEEMADTLAACIEKGITVGLFAFTPVKGTAWAGLAAPPVGRYRRVQVAHHLLRQGYGREAIVCRGGAIGGFAVDGLAGLLADGTAFRTSGCPDCNRPYYNERPGGVMYNYPRPLTAAETAQAIAECEVIGGGARAVAGD
ncbi:radical SAM protein [Anaeroselena agilis]|uniref:Radical SAM protein n=1 Tax=Anaeroselena agilis TaxID=3063788 RepID=A0ABU3P259_9FIRM|nr:radical SAM protein [Selenomonadales bacterium 4137-cl]